MGISEILLINSLSVGKMQSVARDIAKHLHPGDTITLSGEVGSGKTTFARALISAIAVGAPEVTSPTFTLMQSYDVKLNGIHYTLWHLDCYRLTTLTEVTALGLDELWQHIVLIEWPEIIHNILPKQHLDISFDFGKNYDTRKLVFSGDETWEKRMKGIEFEPI